MNLASKITISGIDFELGKHESPYFNQLGIFNNHKNSVIIFRFVALINKIGIKKLFSTTFTKTSLSRAATLARKLASDYFISEKSGK